MTGLANVHPPLAFHFTSRFGVPWTSAYSDLTDPGRAAWSAGWMEIETCPKTGRVKIRRHKLFIRLAYRKEQTVPFALGQAVD